MRFVPRKVHAMLDWPLALLVVAAPWLFGFANGGAEQWSMVLVGLTAMVVTFFTAHETGVVKRIPMSGHNMLDLLSGAFLAASPWILGFADRIWQPHLWLGIAMAIAGLTTQNTSARDDSATATV